MGGAIKLWFATLWPQKGAVERSVAERSHLTMLTVTPSLTLSRRRLGMGAALLASASERALAQASGNCTTVPDTPTTERPDPQPNARDFSEAEVALAFRSHGLQYETLDQQLTPIGEHYLLTHFDIPALSADNY